MTATEIGGEPAPPPGPERSGLSRARSIIGGSAGNLVEWFDWFAYASFSIYFAAVFFPEGDQTAQLLKNDSVRSVVRRCDSKRERFRRALLSGNAIFDEGCEASIDFL